MKIEIPSLIANWVAIFLIWMAMGVLIVVYLYMRRRVAALEMRRVDKEEDDR